MYISELRLLHNLPIVSHRDPSTSKLKRRVSNPRLTLRKTKKQTKLPNVSIFKEEIRQLREKNPSKNPSTPIKRNRDFFEKVRSLNFFSESTFYNLTLQNEHIRPANGMTGHLVETFIPRALSCQFNFRARSAKKKKIPNTFFGTTTNLTMVANFLLTFI